MARFKDHPLWHKLLHPFWQRAPLWLRRRLIWAGSAKFLVGVAAICLNPRGEMLLLEHRYHNEIPWGLPGGWVDRDEAPLPALLREVREETGLEPTASTLLSVFGDGRWVEIVYLCLVPDMLPTIQRSEAASYRWVVPAKLTLRLTRSQGEAVARFLALPDPLAGQLPVENPAPLPK